MRQPSGGRERVRSQVGIGTLIVFISLVLVAAIAGGVLIGTAGFLQTQAEQTGSESTAQAANNINVVGESGGVVEAARVGSDRNITFVYEARLTVKRTPGSGPLNLSELTIQYIGENGVAQFVHIEEATNADIKGSNPLTGKDITYNGDPSALLQDSGDRGEAAYFVRPLVAEDSGDAVLSESGDRYQIILPFGFIHDPAQDAIYLVDDALENERDTVPTDLTTIRQRYETLDSTAKTSESGFNTAKLGVLKPGQEAEITITTASGSSQITALLTPSNLQSEREAVSL